MDKNYPRIKSYVLRNVKMSKGQKRALETLYDTWCLPFSDSSTGQKPCNLEEIFSGRGKIILEIGFGMGDATARIAGENPENGYLGIEVHKPGVGKLLNEINRRNLSNLRIINHDAVEVLEKMIPDESFDGVHIFFPDPWPKKRHHKRRLIQQPFINILLPKIKKGGYLYLVTDWEEYAEQILAVLSHIEGLINPADGFSENPGWRPVTKFERKGMDKDHPIREVYILKGG